MTIIKIDNNVVNQCFEAVQQLLATNAVLFDRNSTLRKMTPEIIRSQLTAYQGYLKKDPVFDVQAIFTEAIMTLIEVKNKPGKEIKDDYNYLFLIFRNLIYKIGKKQKTDPLTRLDEGGTLPDNSDAEVDEPFYLDLNILDILFKRAELKKGGSEYALKIEEVSVFYNVKVYDWDYSEINKALNIPVGTLKSHLHRGKQKIRYFIEDFRDEFKTMITKPN